MTDLPEFPDIPVAEIKHSNGQKETVYQRPDGTEYVAIDILPKIRKPEPQPAMSQPIWPPDPFMPSAWEDYRAAAPTIRAIFHQSGKNWKYGYLNYPRKVGKTLLRKLLTEYQEQQQRTQLEALTAKWIKEHQ